MISPYRTARKAITYDIDENKCHICTSHHRKKVDGVLKFHVCRDKGKFIEVSRFVFEQKYGKLREGLSVRRKCKNVSCINPEHMKIKIPGYKSYHSLQKLTDQDVADIRASKDTLAILANVYCVGIGTIFKIKYGYRKGERAYVSRLNKQKSVGQIGLPHLVLAMDKLGPALQVHIAMYIWMKRAHVYRYKSFFNYEKYTRLLLKYARVHNLVQFGPIKKVNLYFMTPLARKKFETILKRGTVK